MQSKGSARVSCTQGNCFTVSGSTLLTVSAHSSCTTFSPPTLFQADAVIEKDRSCACLGILLASSSGAFFPGETVGSLLCVLPSVLTQGSLLSEILTARLIGPYTLDLSFSHTSLRSRPVFSIESHMTLWATLMV